MPADIPHMDGNLIAMLQLLKLMGTKLLMMLSCQGLFEGSVSMSQEMEKTLGRP